METGPKKIIITGGTYGIGRALVERFAEGGCDIVTCSRSTQELENLHKLGVKGFYADLSFRRQTIDFIGKALDTLGGLDCVIANAAITGIPRKLESELEQRQRTINVFNINQAAQVILARKTLPHLDQTKGVFIFITSGLAKLDNPPLGAEDYARSKKRVEQYLGEIVSSKLFPNALIFSINPGPVDTRMHQEIANFGPEPLAQMSRKAIESNLLTDPVVVAKAIYQIASSRKNLDTGTGRLDKAIQSGSIINIAALIQKLSAC